MCETRAVRRVLVLSGRRFAGKDTLAGVLVALARERGLSLTTYAFAAESKRLLVEQMRAQGVEVELERLLHDRGYKEQWRPRLTECTVAALARDPLIFCRAVAERIECSPEPAVITDLRLRGEVEYLRSRFIVHVLRVQRPDPLRAAAGWRETAGVDDHPTETDLDDPALWDEVVANDGDLAALQTRAQAQLDAWLVAAGASRGDA
jgi:phosphomevalonate kinase